MQHRVTPPSNSAAGIFGREHVYRAVMEFRSFVESVTLIVAVVLFDMVEYHIVFALIYEF